MTPLAGEHVAGADAFGRGPCGQCVRAAFQPHPSERPSGTAWGPCPPHTRERAHVRSFTLASGFGVQTPAPPLKASDTAVALARVLKLRALCRVHCPTRPWWALCDLVQTTNEKLKTRSDRKGWVLPESESRPCGPSPPRERTGFPMGFDEDSRSATVRATAVSPKLNRGTP